MMNGNGRDPDRPTRTYMAVPSHRARLVNSATRSSADAILLDLEDSVPDLERATALAAATQALTQFEWGNKVVSVRINAPTSPTARSEIEAIALLPRLDAVIVPKAERVEDVQQVADWLQAICERNGRSPPTLELMIETARGLAFVERLAAHPSVQALHLGPGDLAASLGARTFEIGASPKNYTETRQGASGYVETPMDYFAFPMMRVLTAARAFGLRALDGPCGNYQDLTLAGASARRAAAMGFDGKWVIHPSQIAVTREAFMPSEQELAYAYRVKEAIEEAHKRGLGAVTLDGKMIDAANIRMSERLLRLAE